MLIRCDKCTTVYELDEKLLPPQGAPVQCSKCQFVFTAYPASATATPADAPASPEPPRPGPAPAPPPSASPQATVPSAPASPASRPDSARSAPAGVPPPEAAPVEPQRTADGRPIRKVTFPTAEATPPSTPRPVITRPQARGLVSGKLVSSSALKWVIPLVLIVAIALAVIGWRILASRQSSALRRRAEGQSLLMPPSRPGLTVPAAPPRA